MDSIATARDFFINQQGLSPDQADMIVSQGLQAYNQQTQPRSMMQMASGGIARLGYQMGGSPVGVQSMPMNYGFSLEVPPQQQPMFTSTGNATSSPLLNYGQTGIGKAGGTPLTMRSGGIARLGYQEGGMTMTQFGAPQEEPIFPRLETLSENLGQAEQTLGQPSNQSSNSPMTSLMMGPQGFAEGGLLSIQLTPVQKMAMGGEIPVRKNQGGVTELDLRAKGGYIPVGIKEKADDVPAMLSKNEFVFTADAVRGAGNGSINKGAQKMYKLMKSLEKKVKKTKVA